MEKAFLAKRPQYDMAFRAGALRLASESRSTLAAARALNISTERIYVWQKASQPPLPADPARETEMTAVFNHHKHCYSTRRFQVEFIGNRPSDRPPGLAYRTATPRANKLANN